MDILFKTAERFEQFGGQSPKEHSCIIFLKIDALVKEKSTEGFSILQLWRPSCSMEPNGLSNFGRGSPKEHSCEILSKSVHRFS